MMLFEDIRDVESAKMVAERIHDAFAIPFHHGGSEIFSTASIGIALGSPDYANRRRPSPGRGHYDVPGEGAREGPLRVLRSLHEAAGRGAAPPRDRSAGRLGTGGVPDPLSAHRHPRRQQDHRSGGPAAVAASPSGSHLSPGIHSAGGRDRSDHSHRGMGVADGLFPVEELASTKASSLCAWQSTSPPSS